MLKMKTRLQVLNVGREERWASVGSGLLIILLSVWRKSAAGLLLLPAGLYLLYRGLWGRCFVYELLGLSTVQDDDTLLDDAPPMGVDPGDEVAQASLGSFPTSDAPSWTMGKREGR